MEKPLKSTFKILNTLFDVWKRVIILLGLEIFAYFVGIKFFFFILRNNLNLFSIFEILLGALLIFFLSFLISRFFPQKFVDWDFNWIKDIKREKKLSDKLTISLVYILFFSPLSSFFMSVGLSLFIFSFIKPEFNILWQKIFAGSEEIYEFLGSIFLSPLYIIYSILFGLIFPWIIFEKILKCRKSAKVIAIWFLIILIILIVHAEIPLPFLRELDQILSKISPKIVQFLIGLPPIGWFYELFLCSIVKEKKVEKSA